MVDNPFRQSNRGQQIVRNIGTEHRPDDVSRIPSPRRIPATQEYPNGTIPTPDGANENCCGYTRMIVWRGPVGTTPIALDWTSFGESIKVRVTNFSNYLSAPNGTAHMVAQPSIGIAFGGVPATDPSANPSGGFMATARIGGFLESDTTTEMLTPFDFPHRDFEINCQQASIVCSAATGGVGEVCIFLA